MPDRACSKELLPVGDKVISEYLIDAMVTAGADRIVITIAPDKSDLVRFYSSGAAHGVPIAYACQDVATGMSDAIDVAYSWLRGATVLMGMPDTIVQPEDTLQRLRVFFEAEPCDIALAIAPTDEPHRLGPVDVDVSGRVLRIHDKPRVPPHNRVWTVACWNARFTEFLHDHLAHAARPVAEAPLGLIFQAAIEQGFYARALTFDSGVYVDAGTLEGLQTARTLVKGPATARA